MDYAAFISKIAAAITAIGWVFLPLVILPAVLLFCSKNSSLNSISKAIISLVDTFSYKIGEGVKWLLPILVLSIAFAVFSLSIFGRSWTKLIESAEYLHASVLMLGAAATLLAGKHVRVVVFHANMSPKSRALVDFIGFYALLLPVCLIILWNSQTTIYSSWRILEGSAETDGIRGEFLLKTLIPIFAVMMILQGLSISLRAAMRLTGQKDIPSTAQGSDPFTENPASLSQQG